MPDATTHRNFFLVVMAIVISGFVIGFLRIPDLRQYFDTLSPVYGAVLFWILAVLGVLGCAGMVYVAVRKFVLNV